MLNLNTIVLSIAERLGTRGAVVPVEERGRVDEATIRTPVEQSHPASLKLKGRWRTVIVEAALLWGMTRIAFVLLSYMSVVMSTNGYDTGYLSHPLSALVANWNRWDAHWYTSIAALGYWSDQATAFFPLYPLFIKIATLVIGQHWVLAALVVTNLASLFAFIGMGLLAAGELGTSESGVRSIRLLAAYPVAFFLAAPYTEALFLAFAAFGLFSMRRGAWRSAAVCVFLAALTRPTGIILILPLLWEFGRQHGWWSAEQLRALIAQRSAWLRRERLRELLLNPTTHDFALVLGAAPVALGLYAVYCRLTRGHFLVFLHVQTSYWHRIQAPIWNTLLKSVRLVFDLPFLSFWQARLLVDLLPVLVFGLITVLCVRRQPIAFTLYMLGLLYLTIATPVTQRLEPDPLFSAGRFLVVAAPMFVLLARWTETRPWLEFLLVASGFMLQAVLGVFFLTGGWLV